MKNFLKEVLDTSLYLLFVLIACIFIVKFVGQRTEVIGSSMEPTLTDGNNLIVEKVSYRFSNPERFDVVVFPYRYDKKMIYIKRIIGLPGETIQIDKYGAIYINDEVLIENYGKDRIENPGRAVDPIVLGENEYFVMGDNRNNSSDSRFPDVGNISRADIIGRAWVRIWPLNQMKFIRDKKDD